MKQITLHIFTLLILALSSLSATAHDFEVNGIYYYSYGTEATVTYKGEYYNTYSNEYTGNVTIPETVTYGGTTYSVTAIGDYAFHCCSGLTSITIPNSVTSIGSYAFNCCSGLTSITIPNSVTFIGGSAFSGCSGLTSINIPNSVTSIRGWAFYGCSGLTSINIPNSVRSIGERAFEGCSSLTSITIPNSVTSIGSYTFDSCSGLTSITIPNSITSIGSHTFDSCSGLTSITIPNSVTSIGSFAFDSCSGLTSITIPNSVNSIGDAAFRGCSGLTSITIPNSVTNIGNGAFSYCSSLTNMKVEDGNPKFDSRNNCNAIIVTATNNLIAGCINTIIPNSVTSIGDYAFLGYSGLTNVTIPNSVTSIGNYAFYGCSGLTNITIPNSVTTIDYLAFFGCSCLTSVTSLAVTPPQIRSSSSGDGAFPSEVTTQATLRVPKGSLSAYKRAYNWKDFSQIIVDNFDVNGIWYRSLSDSTAMVIPKPGAESYYQGDVIIPDSVTYQGYTFAVTAIDTSAFEDCYDLTSVVIGNAVETIGENAFQGCTGLTSVTIGSGVTSIGNQAFTYCSSLTSIFIPNSVTAIGASAFNGCRGLTTVTCLAIMPPTINSNAFPSVVTNQATLYVPRESLTAYQAANNWKDFSRILGIPGINDFEVDGVWYWALTDSTAMVTQKPGEESYYQGNVVIPAVVTYQDHTFAVIAIDEGAFADCYDLTSVVIGDAVETIGENAFQGCTGLTSVTIGSGVTSIGAKAFNYCNALKTVTCRGTVPPVMANANCFSNAAYSRAKLLVPRQQLEAYQAADYWYRFSNIEGWGSCGLGDVNADGIIGISDVTALTNALLTNSTDPALLEYGDLNHNGRLDIGDVTNLIVTLLTH